MRLMCARLESFQKLRVVSEGSKNGDRSELAFMFWPRTYGTGRAPKP